MSVRPSSRTGLISRRPSASCFAPSPLGICEGCLYGLDTKPIGVISKRAVAIRLVLLYPNSAPHLALACYNTRPFASQQPPKRIRRYTGVNLGMLDKF